MYPQGYLEQCPLANVGEYLSRCLYSSRSLSASDIDLLNALPACPTCSQFHGMEQFVQELKSQVDSLRQEVNLWFWHPCQLPQLQTSPFQAHLHLNHLANSLEWNLWDFISQTLVWVFLLMWYTIYLFVFTSGPTELQKKNGTQSYLSQFTLHPYTIPSKWANLYSMAFSHHSVICCFVKGISW